MKRAIIFIGDVVVLFVSLLLTLALRYGDGFDMRVWEVHFWPFLALFAIWLLVFFVNNLYSLHSARNSVQFFGLLSKSLLVNAVLALSFFYLTPGDLIDVQPKTNLLLVIVTVGALLTLWRQVFNKIISTHKLAQSILVLGDNEKSALLSEALKERPQFGYRVSDVVDFDGTAEAAEKVLDLIAKKNISLVVSTLNPADTPGLASLLLTLVREKKDVYSFHAFYEKITGKVPVASIDQMWFVDNLSESNKKPYEVVKRVADITLAIFALAITLPFAPLIWVIIKLDSPGTSFFMQRRTGHQGADFMAIKFRSMRHDAERHGPQWAQKNDSRVTRVGKFMRKTRIDEIPQLVNVLRGDMSFVGPRPERPEFVEKLRESIPFYNERHMVKPGLTGWAQINFPYGASEKDAMEKLQYDLYYIKHRSLALDFAILLKTIRTIISGSGQ